MTYYKSFEEFEKAAEALYLQSPSKVRYTVKYTHSKNSLVMKITDNVIVSTDRNILGLRLINSLLVLSI